MRLKGGNMKLTALLIAISFGTLAYACGGMTHVTSPSMSIETQEDCTSIESVVDHLQPIVIMC
jgi:hypothetical protein